MRKELNKFGKDLVKSILATLVYYEILDYPLTIFELYKYLLRLKTDSSASPRPGLYQVINILKTNSHLKNLVGSENGFFFLKNSETRNSPSRRRTEKRKIAEKRFRKIKIISKALGIIPYLRAFCLNGSITLANSTPQSDIDVLIITERKRIWLVRLLTAGFLHLLRERRHHHHIRNRICLNHFLAIDSLKDRVFNDFASAELYLRLIPITGFETFKRFLKENPWTFGHLMTNFPSQKNLLYLKSSLSIRLGKSIAQIGEYLLNNPFGDWIEEKSRRYQKRNIRKHYKSGFAIATDQRIEFHDEPPVSRIIEAFNSKVSQLCLPELKQKSIRKDILII